MQKLVHMIQEKNIEETAQIAISSIDDSSFTFLI